MSVDQFGIACVHMEGLWSNLRSEDLSDGLVEDNEHEGLQHVEYPHIEAGRIFSRLIMRLTTGMPGSWKRSL